jgi:ATP-dependent DNA helicase DinG
VGAAFGPGGALSASIPGYEARDGQRDMAAAVADVIDSGGTLLAEAGTGTGKTLAYLIPAILSGHRTLISTGTKNLQEQIFRKDIPALRDALGRPFSATVMKGRSNYLCLHRWEIYRQAVEDDTATQSRLIESGDRVLVPILDRWLRQTETGDRAELVDLPENVPLWKEVAADADTCLGKECGRYEECFVTLMRQRAAESDVVIVNHHLLCADAAVRQSRYGEVVPDSPTLIVDEAHQLEDVATQYFGHAFSAQRVEDLVRDGWRAFASGQGGEDGTAGTQTPQLHVIEALTAAGDRARAFFSALEATAGSRHVTGDARVRYTAEEMRDHAAAGAELASALDRLEWLLSQPTPSRDDEPGPKSEGPDAREELVESLARRAGQLSLDLRILLDADNPAFVYFIERRARGLVLRAAPVDVSRIVSEEVLGRFRTVVLTSATLAVDGSFAYARARLGLGAAAELRVPSEFDYHSQALLYLPRRVPHPSSPEFAEAVARESMAILKESRGRAFVLFTSYTNLRTVQRILEMSLPYPILVQGTAPRGRLVEAFKRTPNAVLLGTSSFWQGVDVVGEALSCVIIDKLPFASPSDPITSARIEALRESGGDPFGELQVPLAILTLLQGLGRLIRHRGDRGVLAILDPRLRTMGYGRRFLTSLPPAPVTYEIADVAAFFSPGRTGTKRLRRPPDGAVMQ